jgi:HAD superfamily hydrolase (TIGR01509 family)
VTATPLPLAAALFDMDGLLVDTEPAWTVAEVELAQRLGGEWSDELKARVVGTRIETAVPIILTGLGHVPTADLVEHSMADLLARMVELYRGELRPLPGAVELLTGLRAAGVPVALVSSSYRVLVDAVVDRLGLRFDLVLAGDEVGHAKPHPEPYLTACARLAVDPACAVVLEDSPAGIASGEAAGCAVVAVPSVPGVRPAPGPRRLVLSSLDEVGVAGLRDLVAG